GERGEGGVVAAGDGDDGFGEGRGGEGHEGTWCELNGRPHDGSPGGGAKSLRFARRMLCFPVGVVLVEQRLRPGAVPGVAVATLVADLIERGFGDAVAVDEDRLVGLVVVKGGPERRDRRFRRGGIVL